MGESEGSSQGNLQEPPPDWEKIKKAAEAEKAALDAQRQLLDARRAIEAARDPARKAMDDRLAAAKTAKELADAELAAFKAKIGEVPASGYAGTVALEAKAGETEAALLAAVAVTTAAEKVADAIPQQNARRAVLIYASGEVPGFEALTAFRAQIALVNRAFSEAQDATNSALSAAPEAAEAKAAALPIAGVAGAALQAVNTLIGFFRTDYTVGGVDLSLDDSLLVHALAGSIAHSGKNLEARIPALYNPAALSDAGAGILDRLTAMSILKSQGEETVSRHDAVSSRFEEDAGKETSEAKKAGLLDKARDHRTAADAWRGALALYDSFLGKLTSADDRGGVPLVNIIRESVVSDSLSKDGSLLLVVKLQKSGGSYYTKKNVVTFFGGMPFYHTGGVVVSYVLMDGKEGNVLASGVVPVHGGFVRANHLEKELKPRRGAP